MRQGEVASDPGHMNSLADVAPSAASPVVRVADAMHWGLVTCSADASLRAVAALMSDKRVHCVVVIDESSNEWALWGVVSDLDLVAAACLGVRGQQVADLHEDGLALSLRERGDEAHGGNLGDDTFGRQSVDEPGRGVDPDAVLAGR